MFFLCLAARSTSQPLSRWTKWNDNNSIIYALCPSGLAPSLSLSLSLCICVRTSCMCDPSPKRAHLVHFTQGGLPSTKVPCGVIYVLSVCLQFVQIGCFVCVFMAFRDWWRWLRSSVGWRTDWQNCVLWWSWVMWPWSVPHVPYGLLQMTHVTFSTSVS